MWGSRAFLLLGLGRMDAGVPLLRWGVGCCAQGWLDHTKCSLDSTKPSLQKNSAAKMC